jgi:hypothetical protein
MYTVMEYMYTLVYSTYKTDRHDITEILLKVALNTITLTPTSPLGTVSRAYENEELPVKKYFCRVHFIFNLYQTKNDKIVP